MPRLMGRQTNTGSYVTVAFILGLAIGAGVILEYLGAINLIPAFGQEGRYMDKQSNTTGKLLIAHHTGNRVNK